MQETGCKTPSSVGASSGAAALKRAWSGGVPSAQEQPDAKRARAAAAADEGSAAVLNQAAPIQLRLPQLPPSLLQGMGLSFPAEQKVLLLLSPTACACQ